jgi:hypothetical protein
LYQKKFLLQRTFFGKCKISKLLLLLENCQTIKKALYCTFQANTSTVTFE